MLYNKLIPFSLILTAAAQTVTDVIARNPNTTNFNKILQGLPEFFLVLDEAENITVFAPSDTAFNTFFQQSGSGSFVSPSYSHDVVPKLLTYHVVNGTYKASAFSHIPVFPRTLLANSSCTCFKDGQRVKVETADNSVIVTSGLLSKSRVVTPDIIASNGVIHLIDTVLTIPVSLSVTAHAANLDNLVGALKKANLVNTVDHLPCATIFAPFDTAFSNASQSLSKLSDDQLKEVLKYHVLDKAKLSSDLTDGSDVENINGDKIHIDKENYTIKVDSAQVLTSDVLISNGVVHVIDEVLSVNTDKNDHDDHDHDSHSDSAAGSVAKITKHGLIALGTFILAHLIAL